MTKRQYCQLAHEFDFDKHFCAGQFMSEKLDGQRAIWDGGVSRGLWKDEVPYANTYKDTRFKARQKATGLWSRYGNVIHAPDWFLNGLPLCPLDMELYAGRGRFQFVQSTVRDLVPGPGWLDIRAVVLDTPPPGIWLADGEINERNCKLVMRSCSQWYDEQIESRGLAVFAVSPSMVFVDRLAWLKRRVEENCVLKIHAQHRLAFDSAKAKQALQEYTACILTDGGEGTIIKKANAPYACKRVYDVLKFKPERDAEATVIGYYWGDVPDNSRSVSGEAVGKYLGKMGSLLVEFQGKRFKLSGFTDTEREVAWADSLGHEPIHQYGARCPGQLMPDSVINPTFPRGSLITFKYRELTDDGLPKEARYFRKP